MNFARYFHRKKIIKREKLILKNSFTREKLILKNYFKRKKLIVRILLDIFIEKLLSVKN